MAKNTSSPPALIMLFFVVIALVIIFFPAVGDLIAPMIETVWNALAEAGVWVWNLIGGLFA